MFLVQPWMSVGERTSLKYKLEFGCMHASILFEGLLLVKALAHPPFDRPPLTLPAYLLAYYVVAIS